MHYQIVLAFFVASVEVHQCHSFKHAKRKSARAISATLEHKFCPLSHFCPNEYIFSRRHTLKSATQPIYSIRGGSDHSEEENEYNETAQSFISSFEAELAQIRRDVSMEAENELQKIRGFIERGDELEEEDQMDTESYQIMSRSEENGKVEAAISGDDDETTVKDVVREEISHSNEEAKEANHHSEKGIENEIQKEKGSLGLGGNVDEKDSLDDERRENTAVSNKNGELGAMVDSDSNGPEKEILIRKLETSSDEVTTANEIHEVLPKNETVVAIGKSEIETNSPEDAKEETILVKDDEDLHHAEFPMEPNEVSRLTTLDGEAIGVNCAENEVTSNNHSTSDNVKSRVKVNQRIKPKKSKKKRKLSSKTRKARLNLMDGGGISDEIQGDLGQSILLTPTENEAMQMPQSGIWYYVRSDLGRALLMFIATVVLAILTQRAQRQMEAMEAGAGVR